MAILKAFKTELESPVTKTKVKEIKIGGIITQDLQNDVNPESQVIIHCSYTNKGWCNARIRIWQSTFLYAKNSNHKSKLVHVENMALYPHHMSVAVGTTANFTLIFTGLPKNCKEFDMIEHTEDAGEFVVKNIWRNRSDVYSIEIPYSS